LLRRVVAIIFIDFVICERLTRAIQMGCEAIQQVTPLHQHMYSNITTAYLSLQPTFSMFLTDLTRLSNSLKVADGTGVLEKARTVLALEATRALEPAALAAVEAAVLSMAWMSIDECRG
jgi:hypothetical protein